MKAIIVLTGPEESTRHDIPNMHYVLGSGQLYNEVPIKELCLNNHWCYSQVVNIYEEFLTKTIPKFLEATELDKDGANVPVYGAIYVNNEGAWTLINQSLNLDLDKAIKYVCDMKRAGHATALIKFTSLQLRTLRLPK